MSGVPTFVVEPDSGYELTVVDLDPLRAGISAVGEFDLAARQDVARVLREQERAGHRIVRLNLAQVSLFDSWLCPT